MLKVLRAWRSLSDEQRTIVQAKQLDLNRPVGETIDLLRGIADCDVVGGSSRTGAGCTIAIGVIVAIGAMIAAGNDAGTAIVTGLFIAAAVLFFGALFAYIWMRRIDVSDNLAGFAMPVLMVFRDDIDAAEPMTLRLDLRKAETKQKLDRIEKEKLAGGAKIVDRYYVDPWMSGEAMLVDGSRVRWDVVDTLRVRSKTRTRGGKTKTKTKYAKKCAVDVEVTIRNKSYAVDAAAADAKKTTLRESRTAKREGSEPSDPRLLIEAIADVYRGMTPVK
jgi:hypothetical protein